MRDTYFIADSFRSRVYCANEVTNAYNWSGDFGTCAFPCSAKMDSMAGSSRDNRRYAPNSMDAPSPIVPEIISRSMLLFFCSERILETISHDRGDGNAPSPGISFAMRSAGRQRRNAVITGETLLSIAHAAHCFTSGSALMIVRRLRRGADAARKWVLSTARLAVSTRCQPAGRLMSEPGSA